MDDDSMNRHFIRILDQVNNPQAAAGGGPSNTSHQSEAEPAFHPLNHSPEPPTNDHHSRIGDVELDEHTPEEQARYHADQDYLNQQAAAIQQAHQDPPEEAAASTSTSAEPATAARQSVKGPGMILAHRSSCKTCRKRKMKCDAVRPTCGTCERSRRANANSGITAVIPEGPCVYDREAAFVPAPAASLKARKKRPSKTEAIPESERSQLVNRITELEQQLAHYQAQQPSFEPFEEGEGGGHHQVHQQEEVFSYNPSGLNDHNNDVQDHSQNHGASTSSGGGVGGSGLSSSGLVQLANTASQQAFSQALSASNRRGNSANHQRDGLGGRHHQNQHLDKGAAEEGSHSQIPSWTHDMDDVYAEALHYNQSFDTVALPSYSPDLPPPHVVHHLCEIFFSRHPLRCMLYQPDLMASLSLPPSHPNSVPLSILHAIIASAAALSPYAQDIENSFLMPQTAQPTERPLPAFAGLGRSPDVLPKRVGIQFGEYHMRRARFLAEEDLLNGNSPIDSTQALCLIVYTLWTQARFLEASALAPTLCRLSAPYGLNQLRSRHVTPLASLQTLGYRPVLEPPQSAVDEHLRRMLFWQIWILDFVVSTGSRFETTLKEEFTRTNLPSLTEDWLIGLDPPPNHQTLSSPDLHTHNHLDPFNLLVKAVILYRRSFDFLTLQDPDQTTPEILEDPFKLNGFSKQDEVLFEFVASWPSHLQNLISDEGVINSDLWAAHSITYAAILNLHEPFASGTNLSAHREANAVKAIVKMAHLLASTSYEVYLMHSCFGLGLQWAGRAICRRLAFPWPSDDQASQEASIKDLDLIINILNEWGQKAPTATWSARMLIRFRQRSNVTTLSSRSKAAYTGQLPLERLFKNQAKLLELGMIPVNVEDDLTKSPPPPEGSSSRKRKNADDDSIENGKGKGKEKAQEENIIWTYPMRQKKVRKGLNDWLNESEGGGASGGNQEMQTQ